jgi:hypothetical protein
MRKIRESCTDLSGMRKGMINNEMRDLKDLMAWGLWA